MLRAHFHFLHDLAVCLGPFEAEFQITYHIPNSTTKEREKLFVLHSDKQYPELINVSSHRKSLFLDDIYEDDTDLIWN